MIHEIVTRLRTRLEADVFGAAEYYHAREETAHRDEITYFVLPNTETTANFTAGDFFTINNQVRVIVMSPVSLSDVRNEKSFFDATQERNKLFASLFNWQVSPCFEAPQYVSGALLDASKSRLFYAYTFNFPEQVDSAVSMDADPMTIRLQIKDTCK